MRLQLRGAATAFYAPSTVAPAAEARSVKRPLAGLHMTMTSTYVKRLTKAERARLRPTVDAQGLEHFFDATPPGFHRFFFLACLVDLTPDEVTALGEQIAAMVPARRHRALGGLLSSELEALWLPVDPSASGA